MAEPSYKSLSLPWNDSNLPWKKYKTSTDSYASGMPWLDPRMPWEAGTTDYTGLGGGGGGTTGESIGLLLALTKAS